MPPTVHLLENDYWQIGILPETGASVAFGRVRQDGKWHDVLRPTDTADYDNPSKCASFVLIPWSNRIRDARFRFRGVEHQLKPSSGDGTASHGDTRRRIWQRAAQENLLIMGYHYPKSGRGYVTTEGSAWAWQPVVI